eukprot:TRINITY_DN10377_c0_g1_i1.p1 TRINITY_DN10377_c0_g1~~TRINITY_DN10377_c0_g1_i1.p1  ORF type:complete len:473 (+),score=21.07 TRINITY_DN10377_c0_g1_i1:232-1650(+)
MATAPTRATRASSRRLSIMEQIESIVSKSNTRPLFKVNTTSKFLDEDTLQSVLAKAKALLPENMAMYPNVQLSNAKSNPTLDVAVFQILAHLRKPSANFQCIFSCRYVLTITCPDPPVEQLDVLLSLAYFHTIEFDVITMPSTSVMAKLEAWRQERPGKRFFQYRLNPLCDFSVTASALRPDRVEVTDNPTEIIPHQTQAPRHKIQAAVDRFFNAPGHKFRELTINLPIDAGMPIKLPLLHTSELTLQTSASLTRGSTAKSCRLYTEGTFDVGNTCFEISLTCKLHALFGEGIWTPIMRLPSSTRCEKIELYCDSLSACITFPRHPLLEHVRSLHLKVDSCDSDVVMQQRAIDLLLTRCPKLLWAQVSWNATKAQQLILYRTVYQRGLRFHNYGRLLQEDKLHDHLKRLLPLFIACSAAGLPRLPNEVTSILFKMVVLMFNNNQYFPIFSKPLSFRVIYTVIPRLQPPPNPF